MPYRYATAPTLTKWPDIIAIFSRCESMYMQFIRAGKLVTLAVQL